MYSIERDRNSQETPVSMISSIWKPKYRLYGVFRAVHSGGAEGAAAPARKTEFFFNVVFEFAELFLVAILVQNHKKID